jgi:ubiquinone/menaquinone biosynthesis C-methylase UbiE
MRKIIRIYELLLIIPYIKNKGKLLEIGSGKGWQAKYLSKIGYEVTAIELPNNQSDGKREYSLVFYDGHVMPFRDNTFDIIFSSNVMEHIPHITNFQNEIQRVLKPNGFAIYILPTASWRFWTSFTYYLDIFRKAIATLSLTDNNRFNCNILKIKNKKHWKIFKYVFPSTHGSFGPFIKELYLFSPKRWLSLFSRTGWIINNSFPSNLFYTGYLIMNDNLSINYRYLFSYFLGSSSFVYILKNHKDIVQKDNKALQVLKTHFPLYPSCCPPPI